MNPVTTHNNSQWVKNLASQLGFSFCGISPSGFLADEAPRLEGWLNKNYHGKMQYMENHFDKRLDTTKLVEGSVSVISLLFNYYSPNKQTDPTAPKISMYAHGEDYHHVVKDKLHAMVQHMQQQFGSFNARAFVDSAPVLDKAWAKKSGLGWIGKNSNLINKNMGSYFFIAEVICDLAFEYDSPIKDYCGTCTACIDACPTQAIVEPYVVNGSKCISYFTIELKDEVLPKEMKNSMDNWMFGCDICQDVCPWNRFSTPHSEPLFQPNPQLLNMTRTDWQNLKEDTFKALFKHSAVKRTGYKGLMRNINLIK